MLSLYTPVFVPLTDEANQPFTEENGEELVIGQGGQYVPLDIDDYYRVEKVNGMDEVWFTIKQSNPAYTSILELSSLVDEDGRSYLVRKIDAGANDATVCAQLDMESWKSQMLVGYSNGSATALNTLRAVAPAGWDFVNNAGVIGRRTVQGNYTPYDILMACLDVYGIYIRIDNAAKIITLYRQAPGEPSGAFATRQLNLRQLNYKGTAEHQEFATRLYAFGADGMTFASINGGMPYVDNFNYTDRVVCAVWEDDRYTDPQSLLEDAQRKVDAMAVPARSYECDVIDLKAFDAGKYNYLDFGLLTVAALIDDVRGTSINYQVIERTVYPHYPERNKVIFSDVPVTVQNQVVQIKEAINNPNSSFRQGQAALVDSATNWLTSADGYLILVRNDDGSFKELLAMDTNNTETARNVFRLNNNGIGFSTTGVNGPYTNAWTIDGNLIADFISGGTIEGQIIAKNLVMEGGSIHLATDNTDFDTIQLVGGSDGGWIAKYTPLGVTLENGPLGFKVVMQAGAIFGYLNEQRHFNVSFTTGNIITSGSMSLGGTVTATGSISTGGSIYANGTISVSGHARFSDGAIIDGGLVVVASDTEEGYIYASDGITAGSYGVLVDGAATSGASGTYTFGSRTVTINGGIITSVT